MKLSKHVMAAMAAFVTLMATTAAYAQNASPEAIKVENGRWYAIAAALGLGLAAFGGALGQGRAAAAALEGISRNPGASDKMFTPMILGLALIESLVIYSLIIAFALNGKIG